VQHMTDDTSIGMQLALREAQKPQWREAIAILKRFAEYRTVPDPVNRHIYKLLEEIECTGYDVVAAIEEGRGERLDAEQFQQIVEHYDHFFWNSLRHDAETGRPLPFPSELFGGAWVEDVETADDTVRVVRAIASAADPQAAVAEFEAVCRRAFPESFKEPRKPLRDAEWTERRAQREPYRSIAIDDPRSGLPPEARANPEEYPEDVETAIETVKQAVKRYRKRGTKIADSMSPDSEESP
jgi:hypothetical protein